ncbi:MAG: hypothetical protein IPM74_13695 [Crocinitomicaceae bacterium]|nr:hypothetical protein [Crocinitomicaceae bacterium]MBK8926928.1 hypothetical protein [Crocinitomicaceae bacterium]
MENRLANLIQHATVPPESVIELLKNTLIGTEGSKYQLLDTSSRIHQLDCPHFFYLERNKKAIGTVTICERQVTLGQTTRTALYLRYFAFDKIVQGSSDKVRERNSVFDQYWKKLFQTGQLGDSETEEKNTFFWGYIDPQNLRSFRMNERFGFESAGTFTITAFSRFYPKKSDQVSRIKSDEKEEVLRHLLNFYKGFNFFSTAHLFEQDNYFVLKDQGKIIAGIQIFHAGYKVVSLPGRTGKLLVKILPRVPWLRKIFNPENFRFLATEGIFWLPGHEKKVEVLLEAVLAQNELNTLLMYEDQRADKIKSLRLRTGLLQKLKKNNEIHIVVRPVNLNESEYHHLMNNPVYLSGFDMV